MEKVFEDYFSEIQADMVSVCLEYASNKADKIYIYCSYEAKVISSNFFFRINGLLVRKHKLNDAIIERSDDFSYNTSDNRQGAAIDIINEDIEKISELCKNFNREMPTEMKLAYDVRKGSLVAKYRYDLVYSNIPGKTADDIEKEWFDEMKINPE